MKLDIGGFEKDFIFSMSYFQFIVSWVNGEIVTLHAEGEFGAEILPFQPNMVAMSVLKNSLDPATSNPVLVSYRMNHFLFEKTW